MASAVRSAEDDIVTSLEVKAGDKQSVAFTGPMIPAGREAVLVLKARLDFHQPAGYTHAMRLTLNGKPLDVGRLQNKQPVEERVDGNMQNMAAATGDLLVVGYSPDFIAPDAHPNYAFRRAKVCEFELLITDVLQPGHNELVVENGISSNLKNTLVVAGGHVELRVPRAVPRKKGPPSGPLAAFGPTPVPTVDYHVEQVADSSLVISFHGEKYRVESQFSTPEPKWERQSNRYFRFHREIEKKPEAIVVRDRFTNLTDDNLPLMQQHRVERAFDRVWLAGLSPASLTGTVAQPANPTTYGASPSGGIGLLPLDDVSQVHVTNFADRSSIGVADYEFVLRPRDTHTAEWAVVLTRPTRMSEVSENQEQLAPRDSEGVPAADYFAFVNAVRRLRGVNFTLDGPFAFLRADPRLTGKWSDERLVDFVRFKSARFLCSSIDYPVYQGHYPHGTAFQTLDHADRKAHLARLRRLAPEARHLVYFHCFIDVLEDAASKYPDARLLQGDGTQAVYSEPHDKIFFPTTANAFGRDIARNIEIILGEIGADGVYWDEMEYSAHRYHYGEPWDGVSADIDRATHKIARLKSSVTLLSQPWRIALVQRILSGHPLIANGGPHTRTMAALHFPRFIETGSISNCTLAQLFTPIALGDHLTERNEVDAYRVMLRALDYGCVYYWYNDTTVIPTHPHLTQYMFPITPLELGEGFIVGEERIITRRSGLFGWNDDSRHETHVFDGEGREISDLKPPLVERGGKTFTELRLGEGFSAAIIRRINN